MKYFILSLILLSTTIFSQQINDENLIHSDRLISKVFENLDKIESNLAKNLSSIDYINSKNLLIEIYLLLSSIPGIKLDYTIYAIDEDEFNLILYDLKKELYDLDKLSFIEDVVSSNYFTTDQAYKMIETINSSIDRISAFKLLFKSILDKYKYYKLLPLFENSVDKQTIRNFVSNYFYNYK